MRFGSRMEARCSLNDSMRFYSARESHQLPHWSMEAECSLTDSISDWFKWWIEWLRVGTLTFERFKPTGWVGINWSSNWADLAVSSGLIWPGELWALESCSVASMLHSSLLCLLMGRLSFRVNMRGVTDSYVSGGGMTTFQYYCLRFHTDHDGSSLSPRC